ncbi:hypothetical protein L6452_40285 [Arctium lappa]|uniref:Uncharacterized protein n=1 Tax=Arctium lappa TaxID=4217 RepID=A0ACB8XQM6_ARCLA|nr:hypothetical protein L6452_40285 [Arctium lappa]
MLTPLSAVETTCATLEQEEAQRVVLNLSKSNNDMLAMYSKSQSDKLLINSSRMVASVQISTPKNDNSGLLFTPPPPQQLEQLAKLMPQLQMGNAKGSEIDEKLDCHLSGMISYNHVHEKSSE